ncbi:MAG: hypothetical protein PHS41_11515, partial [Victivallaceae bacterium]|nr:hypothetical protein [Victivallaceae bacterium]
MKRSFLFCAAMLCTLLPATEPLRVTTPNALFSEDDPISIAGTTTESFSIFDWQGIPVPTNRSTSGKFTLPPGYYTIKGGNGSTVNFAV